MLELAIDFVVVDVEECRCASASVQNALMFGDALVSTGKAPNPIPLSLLSYRHVRSINEAIYDNPAFAHRFSRREDYKRRKK